MNLGHTKEVNPSPRRILALQESARRQVSEYLHGHVQSKLLALQYYLTKCQELIPADPDEACRLLDQIRTDLEGVQDVDIRRASHDLYPSIIRLGLLPALRSLRDRMAALVHTDLVVADEITEVEEHDSRAFDDEFKIGVYRIVEEALTNVVKHSGATEAGVVFNFRLDGCLSLAIDDNGYGFDVSAVSSSQGLIAMTDYAEALVGSCRISSVPGLGAKVHIILPAPASLKSLKRRVLALV